MLAYGEEEGWERRPRGDLAVEEWRGVAEGKGRAGSGEEGGGAGDEEQEERREVAVEKRKSRGRG